MTFGEEAPQTVEYQLDPHPSSEQQEIRALRARIADQMHTLLPKPPAPQKRLAQINDAIHRRDVQPRVNEVQSKKVYMPSFFTAKATYAWYCLERSSLLTSATIVLKTTPANLGTPRRKADRLSNIWTPISTFEDNDVTFGPYRHPAQDEEEFPIDSQRFMLEKSLAVLSMIHMVTETKKAADFPEGQYDHLAFLVQPSIATEAQQLSVG